MTLGFVEARTVTLDAFLHRRTRREIRDLVIADAHARGNTPQHESVLRKLNQEQR